MQSQFEIQFEIEGMSVESVISNVAELMESCFCSAEFMNL